MPYAASILGKPIQFNSQELNHWPRKVTNPPYWYSWVRRTSGLGATEIRGGAQPIPGEPGQRVTGDILKGAKPMTLSGIVRGRTVATMNDGLLALAAAFEDLQLHNFEFGIWGSTSRFYYVARVTQGFDFIDEQTSQKPEREWTVQITADDPTIFVV